MLKKIIKNNEIFILIGTALLMQLLGNYYARYFIIGRHFYIFWPIVRILVSLLVLLILRIPLSALNLGLPRFNKKLIYIVLSGTLIIITALILLYNYGQYLDFYNNSFAGKFNNSSGQRFFNFLIFTSSTLPAWEFFHRCFLLMGIIFILNSRLRIERANSIRIAIAIVWIFEVVFHFIKPSAEAFGMLAGSPLLSYLALSSKSIWTAFFAHLIVELIFIFFVIF